MRMTCRVRQLISALVCVASLIHPQVVGMEDATTPEKAQECENPEKIPLVSIEELEK